MDTSNEDEINKFLISYYKSFGLRYSLDSTWFKWFYNDNPSGKCVNYILTNENNEIIGAFGYSIFSYSFNEVEKKGVIGINGFINPDYTGLGLYTDLILETLKDIHRKYDLAFSFPHSDNLGSVKGHINSEWKFTNDFYFYVKNIKPKEIISIDENILESKFECLRNYKFSRRPESFFIKSFEWLNWRFYERPDKDYEVFIYKNSHNIIEGYVVYTLYQDKSGLKRFQIADYDYIKNEVFMKLLAKVSQLGSKYKCSTFEFLVNEEHFDTEILLKESYVKKEESYKMFVNGDLAKLNINRNFKFEFGYFDVV